MFHLEEMICNSFSFYITLAVGLFSILYYVLKTKGIPPGPMGLPYFGLWPFLKDDTCHLQLTNYAKKYGDVYSFTITGRLYIHLGSVKASREAHVTKSDCFAERLDDFHLLRYYLEKGVVYVKGEYWRTIRKFFLQQFRERGMSTIKESLSGPIYDTVRTTLNDLNEKKGQPVDIASIVLVRCNRIMRQTLFGGDGMTEEEIQKFNEYYFFNLMSMTSKNLLLAGNLARYLIAPFMKDFREGVKSHHSMRDMLNKVIQRRKDTFDENNVRDCIDGFFKEKIIRESKNDPTAKYFTHDTLMITLTSIVGEGVLFQAIFIATFLKVLLQYPEEQEKIYRELIEVVGMDRNPEMEDRSKLTYTNAFIAEVIRTTDVFTIFPGMECSRETTVAGYRIPKGAVTVYNFWAAHMNPADYEEPEKFDPSRFIAQNGKSKPDLLTLFGIGKRSCMGEGFVMIQVFLFLTTIVKNFRLTKPVGEKDATNLFFYFDKINICAHPRN